MRLLAEGVTLMMLMLLCSGGVAVFNGDLTSDFFNTGSGELLTPGIFCSVEEEADKTAKTNIRVDVGIYESDTSFTDTSGNQLLYNVCMTYNAHEFMTADKRIPVTILNRLADSGNEERIHQTVINVADASTGGVVLAGGSTVDANTLYVVVRCHRTNDTDSLGDAIYVLGCGLNNLVVRNLSTSLSNIGDPSQYDIEVRWTPTLEVFTVDVGNGVPTDQKKTQTSGTIVDASNQDLSLGDSMYLEVCLAISSPGKFFAQNMASPVGIYARTCKMKFAYETYTGTYASKEVDIIVDGCSTAAPPFWPNRAKTYVFTYADDGDGSTTHDNLFSPNCQRTELFELAIPARAVKGKVDVTIECSVGYCLDYTAECFYPYKGAAAPACPARRKRAAEDDIQEYPDTWKTKLSTSFTVTVNSDSIIEEADLIYDVDESGCFEKTTFFAVTSALGILLLIVFAIALFLFVKIRSGIKDDSSSMEGFKNKAYN